MEFFWSLVALLSIGISNIIGAEILCRSLGLDRVAARPEEYDEVQS